VHVSSIKIDPYLNVDAGTMNPKEYVSTFSMLGSIILTHDSGMERSSYSTTVERSIWTWATTSDI
jgi:hypothetical protein